MKVLQCGNSEHLKTGVHASVLGLAAICGLYNAAAWLTRRQTHLAVNAVLYTVLAAWEQQHVAHHLTAIRESKDAGLSSRNAVQRVGAPRAA